MNDPDTVSAEAAVGFMINANEKYNKDINSIEGSLSTVGGWKKKVDLDSLIPEDMYQLFGPDHQGRNIADGQVFMVKAPPSQLLGLLVLLLGTWITPGPGGDMAADVERGDPSEAAAQDSYRTSHRFKQEQTLNRSTHLVWVSS